MTSPPARRVRRLHIRAVTEDDARQTAVLLADALHTASLPFADQGRFIVIRRLPLGRIPARTSAAFLALHIERVVNDIISSAVAYDAPTAGKADAVAFPGRSEAIIQLARSHARGMDSNEWFWPEVVPGWRSDLSSGERWLLLLGAAHGAAEAALVAAAMVSHALEAGVEDRLLSSIPPGQGARWLRLQGWARIEPEYLNVRDQALVIRHIDVVRRWQKRWGSTDDRLVWLASLFEIQKHPRCVADPRLPSRIAAALVQATAPAGASSGDRKQDAGSPTNRKISIEQNRGDERVFAPDELVQRTNPNNNGLWSAAEQPALGPAVQPVIASPDPSPQQRRSSGSRIDSERVEETATDPSRIDVRQSELSIQPAIHLSIKDEIGLSAESEVDLPTQNDFGIQAEPAIESPLGDELVIPAYAPAKVSGTVTPYAGLFLVVAILKRIGIQEFLAAYPRFLEAGFPVRLVCFIGERVGLEPENSIARALQAGLMPDADYMDEFRVHHLTTRARTLLSEPKARCSLDSPLIAWLTIVRRWCRREAHMGLVKLIRRPGRVTISQTHIDVAFELSQIDIRLRRLALDVDPGWVPWLGHVLKFHYAADNDRIG